MRRGARIGDSSAEPRTNARTRYAHAFIINAAMAAANFALAALVLTWYIRSPVALDNSLGRYALNLMPVFYYLCLTLPFCCIWMWMRFFKQPSAQQNFVPPFLLSLLDAAYAVLGLWLFSVFFHPPSL